MAFLVSTKFTLGYITQLKAMNLYKIIQAESTREK